MALYTTVSVATTRLGRYAGITPPSSSDAPNSALDDYIAQASGQIEEYLGYAWASQSATETIPIDRAGIGQLLNPHPIFAPMTALATVTVPANAQYYGATITADVTEWNDDGRIVMSYPVVYSPTQWLNPVMAGRLDPLSSALKLYPDIVTVAYTYGRTDSPPSTFETVCNELIAARLLREESPDALLTSKQTIGALKLSSDYRDDPYLPILQQLNRYKRR